MFKLLPEVQEKKVIKEYEMRIIVVILFALVTVLTIGVGSFFPSYILSIARNKEVIERSKIMAVYSEAGSDEDGVKEWLADTNRKIAILNPRLDKDRPSAFIDQVIEEKIAGIHLTSFAWTRQPKNNRLSLSISGIADTRKALIDFEARIKESGHFADVTLPVSNLAKESNINFQIRFSPVTNPSS